MRQAVGAPGVAAYTRGIDSLDAAIDALRKPLTEEELSYGWTDDKRQGWLRFLGGVKEGIEIVTDPEHADVLYHLVRWLDHDGIDMHSPLGDVLAGAQGDLRDRFASPP